MGDLFAWRRDTCVGFPLEALGEHLVILGASGSGKTESMLRLAYGARKVYGYQIVYIDAKGDERADTPARFVAAMRSAGARTIRLFPASFYHGWRGSARDLYNRLMAVIDYSESRYYGDVAADVLRLALNSPAGVPRSSQQFLDLLTFKGLMAAYKSRPQIATIASLDKRLLNQVTMRYRVFFGAVEGQLDGQLGYEDADALYVQIKGFTLRDEAPRLGRFLALDFAHYLAERKPRPLRTLLLIDEVNALRVRDEMSILYEQARSFGAGIILSSQSYAGLGPPEYAERIMGAANTYILHRCSDPERVAERAGKIPTVRANYAVQMGVPSSAGHMQLYNDWKVNPDVVRQQAKGEAFLIHAGRAQQLRFKQVPVTAEQIADAWDMIREAERDQQARRQAQPPQSGAGNPGAPGKSPRPVKGPAPVRAQVAPGPGKSGNGQPDLASPVSPPAGPEESADEADRI
jgi:hypothetical protein